MSMIKGDGFEVGAGMRMDEGLVVVGLVVSTEPGRTNTQYWTSKNGTATSTVHMPLAEAKELVRQIQGAISEIEGREATEAVAVQ